MANIPIRDIPGAIQTAPSPNALLPMDNGTAMEKTTVQAIVDSGAPVASKSEAEVGTDNTNRMTALRVKESIASEVGITIASSAQGDKADSAVQPTRTISAGAGLVGGGDLSANRSFALSSTALASLALADTAVQPARSITAGTGLTGGGNLSANRIISLSTATQASLALADTSVQPSRTISAGTGLTGGGDLSANRTISLSSATIASLAKADTAVQTVNGSPPDGSGNISVSADFVQEKDTVASAASESFGSNVKWVRTAGRLSPGDKDGGTYIDVNNGNSSDTFTSGDGRTWYRAFETNGPFDPVTMRVPYGTHTFKTPMSLDNTPYSLTRGASVAPSNIMEPIIAVKKISNAAVAGTPSTVGAFMMEKRTNAPQAHHTALLAEVLDYAGWDGTGLQNFCEGARLQAILAAGANNGSAYGTIALAGCSAGVNYKYMIGCEGDVINNGGDAPVPGNFNKGKFAVSFLATPTFGTFKPDAGFATNPYASSLNMFRTGFLVTEDSVEVAAFANRADVIFGLDLACGPGTTSYSAIRIPNAKPIHSRNAAGSGDVVMAYVDPANAVVIGGGTGIKFNISGTIRQVTVDGNGFLKLL